MKHYKELIDIEDVSIQLSVLEGAARAMTYGISNCNRHDVEYTMHHLTDQIEDLNTKLRERFDILFEKIKEDENETKAKPTNKKG
jgi:hypothetical protein